MKHLPLLLLLVFVFSCQSSSNENTTQEPKEPVLGTHHSASVKKVFEAHGGFENWNAKRQLSFERGEEKHLIELRNRKVLVKGAEWTIGSDGSDVWISPIENSYRGDPRFFHNLYFYFFSMPFVLGDPGIYYEDIEDREIKGVKYGAIKISYGEDVGDSPKDNYIIHYDKSSYEMVWLMYTATFRTQEVSENFSLIKYEGWKAVDGVKLPSQLVWYEYKDGVVGNPRREVPFENIIINSEIPDNSLFAMPEDAKKVDMASTENQ